MSNKISTVMPVFLSFHMHLSPSASRALTDWLIECSIAYDRFAVWEASPKSHLGAWADEINNLIWNEGIKKGTVVLLET